MTANPLRLSRRLLALFSVSLLMLSGCSAMRIGFDSPTVNVQSFKMVPGDGNGGIPTFEIGLRVLNPNAEPLRLRGISYTISLNDKRLMQGVGNNLPVIEGYGEGDVMLTATVNLLNGIQLFRTLMNTGGDTLRYEFEAKLDPGAYQPKIKVRESGEVSLAPRSTTL